MILVDGRYLRGGIGHYVRGLIPLTQSDLDLRFFGELGRLQEAGVPSSRIMSYPAKHFSPRFLAFGGLDAALQHASLIHFVHFDLPVYIRIPYVVTIHDLFPRGRRLARAKRVLAQLLIRRAAQNATAVITGSHTVQEHLYRHSGRRATVIRYYHNLIDRNQRPCPSDDLPEKPRILWVGSEKRHKGLAEALGAFRLLKTSVPAASMALLGIAPAHVSRIQGQLARLGLDRAVEILPPLNEDAKVQLIQTSHVLMQTSSHEGFGLVPGEGILAGTPVLARDLPVLREVYGDAIHYYSGDIASLSRQLKEVLGSRHRPESRTWSARSLDAFVKDHYVVYKRSLGST